MTHLLFAIRSQRLLLHGGSGVRIVCIMVMLQIIAYSEFAKCQQVNYWQQQVNYTIRVTLNDSSHFLSGDISIEYFNNSPDTLNYIWFHLWPNAYKNNETAFARQQLENGNAEFYYSSETEKGFIDSIQFAINGNQAVLEKDEKNIDITRLLLKNPLFPGEKIIISSPFRVRIPRTFSRFGHIKQSYQITQWYPKPAVYDSKGWHPMPYLDQGEFYSDFGSFDVTITLPDNYIVGTTGSLQNEKEMRWLDSLAAVTKEIVSNTKATSMDVVAERSSKKAKAENVVPSSKRLKTLNYKADNVHDFAWFADKEYLVMKSKVSLSNHDVITWAMFKEKSSSLWKNAIHFVDSSIHFYSKWVGDYPYPQATAVEGALKAGDGMEYPMITVVSDGFQGVKSLETVIAHEIGHNWFYGILGFNERNYGWMDEGINSFYENRYVEARYPHHGLLPANSVAGKLFDLTLYPRSFQNYLLYDFQANRHEDQPMNIGAAEFTTFNYAAIVYAKTAEVWRYLEAYLGRDYYDELMHNFFNQWKYKHPDPKDLRSFFEQETTKEFGWLFDEIIPTNRHLDYKLKKIGGTKVIGSDTYQKLTIVNKGDIKGPYTVDGIKHNKITKEIWYEGFDGQKEVLFPKGNYDAFRIDAAMNIPEVNRRNNTLRVSGMFRHIEKLRFQWLGSLDNPKRTQLFFTPTIGSNNYDKLWLGFAFYNSPLSNKPLSFLFMPAYGTGSYKLIGVGEVNLQLFLPGDFIHRINLSSSIKSFSYADASTFGTEGEANFRFIKFTQQIKLNFKQPNARSTVQENLIFRNIFLRQDFAYLITPDLITNNFHRAINQLTYSLENRKRINPFGLSISIEGGSSQEGSFYLKTYMEAKYRITYSGKKSGVDLRLFTGTMLSDNSNLRYSNFHLGPTTGAKDYRFDEIYLGRMESTGWLSQQISISDDGGFKMRTDGMIPELGYSDTWIVAINSKAAFPYFLPVFVFADAGILPAMDIYSTLQFDAGIGIKLIPDIVEVYFPLIFSHDIRTNLNRTDIYNTWYKRISFTFDIGKVNPFELIRNFTF